MDTSTNSKLPGAPPGWVNRATTIALHIPGLRSLLGRSLATLTVTGASSGRRYTTPVQYVRDGQRYVVISLRHRRWWRNIASRPDVELLVAGRTLRLSARIAGRSEALDLLARVVGGDPRRAKAFGIPLTDGAPDPDGLAALEPRVVVIVIGE